MSTSKRWCYTLNNYDADEALILLTTPCTYHIQGKEVSSTGTPHLQGYIILEKTQRLSGLKKIHPHAHWEIAKGTTEENIKYCSKENNYEEIGQRPKSSKAIGEDERERWSLILKHAKEGTLEQHDPSTFFRHYSTAERIYAEYARPKPIERTCNVFYGATGTGKSYDACSQTDPNDTFVKDPRSRFWYGYSGQKNMIIDEFRGGIDIAHLLRWLDRYPYNVEIKNSNRVCKVENIWITSNLHPRDWYPDLDEDTRNALLRRIKVTRYWGVLGKDVTKTIEN